MGAGQARVLKRPVLQAAADAVQQQHGRASWVAFGWIPLASARCPADRRRGCSCAISSFRKERMSVMSLPATSHRSSAMNPLPITESHKAVDWTAAQRSDDIHQKHPNMAGRREQLRLGSKVVVTNARPMTMTTLS
jgi:hypothetical protein